ncbi:MAG: hypothetical protein H6710_20080 [Myxococcales bacterium]|nr:hypothetical protein [Myxococcales bacterium]MCB9706191.1 hypothetical protein [Myxococcales bacterium]
MARLARALLALLAIVAALVIWRGELIVGLDFRGGAHLEVTPSEPGVAVSEALEQVRHGVEGLPFDADVRVRHEQIVIEVQDGGEAELDQILEAVQAVDLRFLAVTPSPWWGEVERAELGAARIGSCGAAPDLEADARAELDAAIARLSPPPADRVLVVEATGDKAVAFLAEREPVLEGRDVAQASVLPPTPGLDRTVRLVLRADAAERFGRATEALKGDCLAVVFDGAVITAPVIWEAIPGGEINLAMGLSSDAADAERVARALSAGRHIPLAVAFRTAHPSIYPPWLGLPLLQALAWVAALVAGFAALRREPARWLPLSVGLGAVPIALAVHGMIGGVLSLASFVGAIPAALAAALSVLFAGRCERGASLGRRFVAAWPGWLLLAAATAAALGVRPLGGFWAGVGIVGAVGLPSSLILAALGVVATSDATVERR